ncbi:MAG: hypothetical protein F2563_00870 [Actinobacteria bacterium]|jgi:hypothetical protein|uniref:Unannotated protein n=1 Tax=freshwater metagenome TaxID=449393 RepID=A0A6J6E4E1_9ZZZZ|nr:hypothetical protein [Actinomycetota bacterium]
MANLGNEQPFPGSIPFRPLTIGDILGGLLRTVKLTWRVLIVVGLVVGFAAGILSLVITFISNLFGLDEAEQTIAESAANATTNEELIAAFADLSDNLSSIVLGFSLALVSALVMQVIATGVITHIAADAILGRKISGSDAWARIQPRILGLIVLSIAVFLIAIAGAAIGVVPILLLAPFTSGISAGFIIIGLVAALVFAIAVSIRLGLAAPIYILEQTTIGKALSRSNDLVKGSSWRVLGYVILSSIIAQILGSVFSAPSQTAALAAAATNPGSGTATFLESISTVISTGVALPVTATVLTLVYADLRIRKENFADELRRASEG